MEAEACFVFLFLLSVLKDACYVGIGTSFDVIARPVEAFSVS